MEESSVPSTEAEWDGLISSWLAGWERGKRKSDYDMDWWAVDAVGDRSLEDLHELLWEFVLRSFEKDMSERVFAILAAGPLEDLLAKSGTFYIDRVEELARKNPRFNRLLGGVWKNSMTDDVWIRVQNERQTVW